MYTEYFGLNEEPFSISPDPRYLYLSQRHADALAHLLYGVSESGGFIQLTGEVGTGKTTLIRSLLGQLPEGTEIALILNPKLSTNQFLKAVCHELRVPWVSRDMSKTPFDRLNKKLLELHAANKRVILIVDEAQTMNSLLLEQIRLLTNLETAKQKLLQILLIGQPELRDTLAQANMRQIAQRITGRYHLEPLSAEDTMAYVGHRMKIAGGRPEVFSPRAVRKLYRLSRGIPRLINVIADRSLLAAYTRDETRIGARLVKQAADEVFGHRRSVRWWPWAAMVTGVLAMIGLATTIDYRDTEELQLALVDTRVIALDSPEPAPIAAARPTLAELLALGDSETATADLFRLWNAEYSAVGAAACEQIATTDLRCLELDGSPIGELKLYDRPVLLELFAPDGTRHRLLLTGLDAVHARVFVGDRSHRIAIAELAHYEFGRHLLLWRPALTRDFRSLAVGARGTGVVWLRVALAEIMGIGSPSDEPEVFDASLADAVRDYQRSRGLDVDGVVGDHTLIRLQSEIGLVGVPLEHQVL